MTYSGVSLHVRQVWMNDPGDDAESPEQENTNEQSESSVLMAGNQGLCLFRPLE